MCGIAGLILVPACNIRSELIRSLSERLEHRGPDDFGWLSLRKGEVKSHRKIKRDFIADAVLVHRRLSILDLTSAGWQPMASQEGRYHIVFNGEIYNYLELQRELKSIGYRFRSRSDTEVLLAAYAQWGAGALSRLVGMFAFAILDLETRKLFLARDVFGIKPLYYTYWQDGFAFASEIKPLLELPGVHRRINPQRLYDYLRFGITDQGGETLIGDIKQLPAAHFMEVPLDHPQGGYPSRYWEIDFSQRTELSFNEAANRLRELFLESVGLHLRSDVPVGAALSGGIDSSSIVMAMRHLEPDVDIHTFSYIADDPKISEERWVDLVGRTANATVHKVKLSPNDLMADLDALVDSQEQAFGSTNIYAQREVFRQAREVGIKVMLDGQGADELLGGYHYYIAARLASLLRQGQWTEAGRLVHGASKLPGAGMLQLWCRAMDFLVPSKLQAPMRRMIKKDLVPPWLNLEWFQAHDVEMKSVSYTTRKEILRESLHHDLTDLSLPQLLRYEDRNSMAFSIESRVPFLTPKLASFILSLPEEYLIAPNSTTKAVFRQAMRGIVPDVILDRGDKIGFATPEKDWLFALRPWVERVLASKTPADMPALDFSAMRQEWNWILGGRRSFDWRVWRWVNVILWAEKFHVSVN
jgi:asparagine synthase (glutamine-hydrolysing)